MVTCRSPNIRQVVLVILTTLPTIVILHLLLTCRQTSPGLTLGFRDPSRVIYDHKNHAIPYSEDMDIIFIGGMPRSGTTLMRVMLDAHPDVRCGEETRIIPRILGMRSNMEKSLLEKRRLDAAGVTSEVLDSAVRAFMLEVIVKHGEAAPRLCNKDPFTLKSALYLSDQFPRAKFLLMIRDGRAVVHSIISRKVTILGFNMTSYRKCLGKWNSAMETMYYQCQKVGAVRCLPVYYEQLVLHPRTWMRKIVTFLDLPWNDSVLHHQDFIGDQISLSSRERSTDQVIRPVNTEALSKWVSHIPDDVRSDMPRIAPMLATLGYDPLANPPDYGKPDPQVADNTLHLRQNADLWKQKEKEVFDRLGGRPPDYWKLNRGGNGSRDLEEVRHPPVRDER